MNQILNTDLHRNEDLLENTSDDNIIDIHSINNSKYLKKLFQFQFILSVFLLFAFVSFYLYNQFSLNRKENYANTLKSNYSISQLYSKDSIITTTDSPTIIGMIEIPKISLSYPIFSYLDDELLKVSPCKFFGKMPPEESNLCIAGHNYDNNKFFSNINILAENDEIIIYNQSGQRFSYFVVDKYEVADDDLSPTQSSLYSNYELTLITCNNFNKNRIVIKACIN